MDSNMTKEKTTIFQISNIRNKSKIDFNPINYYSDKAGINENIEKRKNINLIDKSSHNKEIHNNNYLYKPKRYLEKRQNYFLLILFKILIIYNLFLKSFCDTYEGQIKLTLNIIKNTQYTIFNTEFAAHPESVLYKGESIQQAREIQYFGSNNMSSISST